MCVCVVVTTQKETKFVQKKKAMSETLKRFIIIHLQQAFIISTPICFHQDIFKRICLQFPGSDRRVAEACRTLAYDLSPPFPSLNSPENYQSSIFGIPPECLCPLCILCKLEEQIHILHLRSSSLSISCS